MPAQSSTKPLNVLATLAFAGLCTALLARGVLIILMAPALAQGVSSSSSTTAPTTRRDADRPKRIVAFPALAKEMPEEPVATETTTIVEPEGSGPLVPLKAEVVGITWYDEPTWSLANLVVQGDRTVHSVNACDDSRRACNEVAPGYKLVEIQFDRVFLLHEASMKRQEIELNPKGPVQEVASAAPPEPAPASTDNKGKGSAISKMMDGVKQVGPNHWESPPGMREDVLGRLSEVAMEGRWMPYFEGGKITGFKLAQTAPNSAFEKIGLKSGDVIKSVNGYDISSPDKMLDVFTKLRDARDVNVDIQRGNGKSTLKYTIN
ncbi:MAG: type II secretion system protein GspC [Myxococcota bacterium]